MPTAQGARAARWPVALIVAATVVVYLNSFQNAFLWDDLYLIVDNPQIKQWRRLPELFSSDLFPRVMLSHYYRPLQAVTYLFDYQLWGLQPLGFHLTSTLVHAGTAVLFYWLVSALLADTRAALIAALLFAVHPVHTEAVTYISGRSDPLGAFFMLTSLLCFLRARQAPSFRWHSAAALAFLLALLAREAAVVLVGLMLLIAFTLPRTDEVERGKRWINLLLTSLSYGAALLAYGALRVAAIGTASIPTETAQTPLAVRLLTMLQVVVQYLALLLVPVNLHMEREVTPAGSVFDPLVLGAAVLVAGTLAVAWVCRRRAWPVTFGLAWFVVALIPVSNVVPLATYMAEHWLYVPSMGLFLVVGWGLSQLAERGWQQPVAAGVVVGLAAYGGLTVRRNADWRDGVTLYEATVRLAPQSARAWSNLGHSYQERGELQRATEAYQHALRLTTATPDALATHGTRIAPDPSVASHQRALVGNIYREQQHFDDALREFRAALAFDPANVSAYNNLALTLEATGRTDEAKQAFETALRLYPDFAAAHSNLGNLYFHGGDLDRAQAEYVAAIGLNPDYAEAYNNLGSVYFRMGRPELAEGAYRKALQINPGLEEVRRNLGVVLQSQAR